MINNKVIKNEQQFPTLLNWTDNKTAKSWIKKAATKTEKGKALQRILCSIMINNPLGIKTDYIKGETNVLADSISRVFTSSSNTSFYKLHQTFPYLKFWMRFHPSHELLSAIYSALLTGLDPGISQIKKLGHFSRDNNIS